MKINLISVTRGKARISIGYPSKVVLRIFERKLIQSKKKLNAIHLTNLSNIRYYGMCEKKVESKKVERHKVE